ncbi:MAG: SOS response-associated peptidase [Chloracidobacterium sp.]|nr:SOS response-associated peptidase [Chloracidobacterium sp.]
MCGRISQVEVDEYYHRVYGWPMPDYKPRRNIKPTQNVPIFINEGRDVKEVVARWWAQWDGSREFNTKYATFNARVDRLDDSRLWSGLLKKEKRCVVPVSSFYEWPYKGKPPAEIFVKGRLPFGLAGLWSTWFEDDQPRYSFTIFTTGPNEFMQPIHPKAMPVMLDTPELHKLWLLEGDRDVLIPYTGQMESETLPAPIEKVYPDEGPDE